MRECTACHQLLPDEVFDYRGGGRKGLQATCRPCSLERLRDHRRKMRSLIDDHKTAKGCTECGYNGPPYVLHLDHIDPLQKRNRGKAGRAVEVSWSEERIRDELDKCQVLCANCHAIKTFTSNDHLTI